MTPTVHVVEPGGRGGVYQHSAALAAALADSGIAVVLHTAADAEVVAGTAGANRRRCFWRFAGVRPFPLRRAAVVAGWLAVGVPALLARVHRGDVVHVEGRFRPVLLVPLVIGARLRGNRVVLSPHTTYSRRGRSYEEAIVRWMARRADAVLAFSDHDGRQIESWGAKAVRVPLVFRPPVPDEGRVAGWRRRWGAVDGRPVVLFAGQLRADKGLNVLVHAAGRWQGHPAPPTAVTAAVVAVVGEDLGALAGVRRLADELGVRLLVDEGYQPLEQFVAAVGAADVVVCPYRVASQSGVLAMATALGRPTVASDVGGLSELATVVVAPDDAAALAAGVERALETRPCPPPAVLTGDFVARYLEAYGLSPVAARSS